MLSIQKKIIQTKKVRLQRTHFKYHSINYTNSKSICKGTFVTIEISLVIEVFPLALTQTE